MDGTKRALLWSSMRSACYENHYYFHCTCSTHMKLKNEVT